jgi:hypothetical protein
VKGAYKPIPSFTYNLFSIANPSRIAALTPNLTADTLLEDDTACPYQTVNFTCQTTGPLAWSSDEYIGTGGRRLEFGRGNSIGDIRRSGINYSIYAVLVNTVSIDPDNSINITTSTLHIKASSNSSVKCTATAYQTNSVIHMRILGKLLSSIHMYITYPYVWWV